MNELRLERVTDLKQVANVAIISPCQGRYGGLEGFVLAIARGVRSAQEVNLNLCFKQTDGFELGRDLETRVADSGAKVTFVRKASMGLVRAISQADVVHVQNPCPDVVFMARAMGKPLLINVINYSRGGTSLHERLWRLCLGLGHRRFYISEFVRRTWEKSEQPWRNSKVVFPICDLSTLEPLPPEQRKGFVFVGRWIENKGIDTLVEAYGRAGLDPQEWPLQLLGDGPLRQRLEALVSKLGLRGVQMPGFVDETEKGERIRRSKFAVIPPNTREDFGLVAVEARHLGVPCIVTRDGGLPEAAGRHSLICEPGDVEGLAALLKGAAAMQAQEYASLARMTHESLPEELVAPSFYTKIYSEMARGSRTSVARG